jgi:sensor domain CHASE-containing protein
MSKFQKKGSSMKALMIAAALTIYGAMVAYNTLEMRALRQETARLQEKNTKLEKAVEYLIASDNNNVEMFQTVSKALKAMRDQVWSR